LIFSTTIYRVVSMGENAMRDGGALDEVKYALKRRNGEIFYFLYHIDCVVFKLRSVEN
jgi:hypothetical protein